MLVIDHARQPVEWRGIDKNVEHRTIIDGNGGSDSLTVWEHYTPPGAGAPPHFHPHEETITVLRGAIKARIGGEVVEASAGQTLFIPANAVHSFGVVGEQKAHLLFAFPVGEVNWERTNWQ